MEKKSVKSISLLMAYCILSIGNEMFSVMKCFLGDSESLLAHTPAECYQRLKFKSPNFYLQIESNFRTALPSHMSASRLSSILEFMRLNR
jgi:hypothetical protein